MISGSLAGPNTIRARMTISRTSIGPIPKTFIAAGLCRPHLPSVDYESLRTREELVREVLGIRGRDPYLAFGLLVARAGHTLQDIPSALGVELGEHIVKQH